MTHTNFDVNIINSTVFSLSAHPKRQGSWGTIERGGNKISVEFHPQKTFQVTSAQHQHHSHEDDNDRYRHSHDCHGHPNSWKIS